MSLPQENIFYRNDSIDLEFQLFLDKENDEYWDLTNNEIRFELYNDAATVSIKKATANVTGGGDDQIDILNVVQGRFLVMLEKEDTDITPGDYKFEIEVTTADGKRYTVLQSELRLLQEKITWESK